MTPATMSRPMAASGNPSVASATAADKQLARGKCTRLGACPLCVALGCTACSHRAYVRAQHIHV